MKVLQTTEAIGNRILVHLQYIREHWYEWFYVVVSEGYERPLWYLPVRRKIDRHAYECWIFPIAPFVLIGFIVNNIFWSVWSDLITFQELLAKKSNHEN